MADLTKYIAEHHVKQLREGVPFTTEDVLGQLHTSIAKPSLIPDNKVRHCRCCGDRLKKDEIVLSFVGAIWPTNPPPRSALKNLKADSKSLTTIMYVHRDCKSRLREVEGVTFDHKHWACKVIPFKP